MKKGVINLKIIITAIILLAIVLILIFSISPKEKSTQSDNDSNSVSTPSTILPNQTSPQYYKKLTLENHDQDFFSIKKPENWEVTVGGSCSTFSFVIRDKNYPENMVFYFGTIGPVYLSENQKIIDQQYMDNNGFPVSWFEMPVINPLTPENFLENTHLISETKFMGNFMADLPELQDIEIITSTPESSPLGDTELIRALFKEQGNLGEGLFYIATNPLIPETGFASSGIGYGFSFIGITSSKDDFKYYEPQLLESIESLTITQEYVDNCIQLYLAVRQEQNQQTQAILKTSKTLSETSDTIMEGWENRNKVDDILSEKRSDSILGRDRVYNLDTDEVYEVDTGWYDDYDLHRGNFNMNDLQKLPDNNWDLWTAPAKNADGIS